MIRRHNYLKSSSYQLLEPQVHAFYQKYSFPPEIGVKRSRLPITHTRLIPRGANINVPLWHRIFMLRQVHRLIQPMCSMYQIYNQLLPSVNPVISIALQIGLNLCRRSSQTPYLRPGRTGSRWSPPCHPREKSIRRPQPEIKGVRSLARVVRLDPILDSEAGPVIAPVSSMFFFAQSLHMLKRTHPVVRTHCILRLLADLPERFWKARQHFDRRCRLATLCVGFTLMDSADR